MNLERRIRRLNKRLADEFGSNPHGEPNFKWVQTTAMHFWTPRATGGDVVRLESGLWVPVHKYDRHSWAEVHGNCWMLAKWDAPEPYEAWTAKFGSDLPWPNRGEYHLVENIRIPNGKEPDDEYTTFVIYAIGKHLGKTFEDHLRDTEATANARNKDVERRWSDFVDDAWPAFNHTPGKCDGVSFGGIE